MSGTQLIQPCPMPTKYLYFSKSLLPLDKKTEAKAVDDALSFLENTSEIVGSWLHSFENPCSSLSDTYATAPTSLSSQ